ncbi:sigma factor SigB regulation protein RsbQ [Flavobacterium rivuli WB 3.3-2 = DSM 21788]|uniref:Sigma factor SigB regulation protein RsbQ n=1 Tax=Flavobacterium rivuli WB 3.3-2 = DSM 21788 TaxID=1121895 RepID=A0A0A2MCA6_9FLAO|nr:alpha/beta hydrolase [Flavobacterium rivuli]KGO85925.1 sigma factor SigB regulation protein RsbQ [Flavobacterium rivuli WB 3.3-2 = DSM 21788]
MDVLQRNNVRSFGKGSQTLLFAHGFGCDQNMWRFITPAFEAQFKIVTFDYVGCGNSDMEAYNPNRYSSLHGYAQDIIELCDALELNQIIFIGHSVSCMIGALASIQRMYLFKSLIMIGPSAKYVNDDEYYGGFSNGDLEGLFEVMDYNYIGWASFLAPVVMKNSDQPELAQELEESFCATDPDINRKFARVTFFSDNRDDLKKLKVPSLIMQCSEDAIAPDEVGHYVAHNIPFSTFVKMEATGHCPHLSHPAETISIIHNYISA